MNTFEKLLFNKIPSNDDIWRAFKETHNLLIENLFVFEEGTGGNFLISLLFNNRADIKTLGPNEYRSTSEYFSIDSNIRDLLNYNKKPQNNLFRLVSQELNILTNKKNLTTAKSHIFPVISDLLMKDLNINKIYHLYVNDYEVLWIINLLHHFKNILSDEAFKFHRGIDFKDVFINMNNVPLDSWDSSDFMYFCNIFEQLIRKQYPVLLSTVKSKHAHSIFFYECFRDYLKYKNQITTSMDEDYDKINAIIQDVCYDILCRSIYSSKFLERRYELSKMIESCWREKHGNNNIIELIYEDLFFDLNIEDSLYTFTKNDLKKSIYNYSINNLQMINDIFDISIKSGEYKDNSKKIRQLKKLIGRLEAGNSLREV